MRLSLFSLISVLLISSFPARELVAEPDVSTKQIIAAWNNHASRIKSFEYRCTQLDELFLLDNTGHELAPFGPPTDESSKNRYIEIGLKQELTVVSQNSKRYLRVEGEFWDESKREVVERVSVSAFDGSRDMAFSDGSDVPFAMGAFQRTKKQTGPFGATLAYFPLLLWADTTKYLEFKGYDLKTMQIVSSANLVSSGGKELIDLTLDPGGARYSARLVVFKDPPHYLVQLNYIRKGKRRIALDMTYAKYGDEISSVSSWDYLSYGAEGDLRNAIKVNVKSCVVNGNVDENVFSPKFPVGAHTVEKPADRDGEDKFWRQTEKGLVPMREEDYGRLPEDIIGSSTSISSPRQFGIAFTAAIATTVSSPLR